MEKNSFNLFCGDNLKILRKFDENSFDSIVTDPPYGISFMKNKWDYDLPPLKVFKECLRTIKPGGHMLVACGTKTQHRMAVRIEDAGFEIRDIIAYVYSSGHPNSKHFDIELKNQYDEEYIEENYSRLKKYFGYGTRLKPAMELWTLAKKPCSERTNVANVIKYGTGLLNIQDSKIKGEIERFPANFIHDGSNEFMDQLEDQSVSRFFYCSKASKNERNKGLNHFSKKEKTGSYEFRINGSLDGKKTLPEANNHPTVKPIKLMRYLCKLVTPQNGLILDPYMGSGSTGVAAIIENFNFVGIEIDKYYCEIAEARIECERNEKLIGETGRLFYENV